MIQPLAPMFTAPLFTMAKLWKQPDAQQLMNGLRKGDIYKYTYNGVFFSHKKNEIMLFANKWMELEVITLYELSQAQKDKDQKSHIFPHKWKLDLKDKCVHKYIDGLTYIYVCILYILYAHTYIYRHIENITCDCINVSV
jgi:hypothetical protein